MADTTAYRIAAESLPEGYLPGFISRIQTFMNGEVAILDGAYHVQTMILLFIVVGHLTRLGARTGDLELQVNLGYSLGTILQEAVALGSELGSADAESASESVEQELNDILTKAGISR